MGRGLGLPGRRRITAAVGGSVPDAGVGLAGDSVGVRVAGKLGTESARGWQLDSSTLASVTSSVPLGSPAD